MNDHLDSPLIFAKCCLLIQNSRPAQLLYQVKEGTRFYWIGNQKRPCDQKPSEFIDVGYPETTKPPQVALSLVL